MRLPALCFFTPNRPSRPSRSPPTPLQRPSCSHPHLLPPLQPLLTPPHPSHSPPNPPVPVPAPQRPHSHLLPHLHPHSATSSSSATPHFEDNPPHFPLHSSPSPPRITSRQPLTTSLPHVVLPGHLRLLRLNSRPRKLCLAPPMRFSLFFLCQCFMRLHVLKTDHVCSLILFVISEL